jgi:hypothetical protein
LAVVDAGSQMVRLRQSSLGFASRIKLQDVPENVGLQAGGAEFVGGADAGHFGAGWGAFQRRSPTGAAAKGTPFEYKNGMIEL